MFKGGYMFDIFMILLLIVLLLGNWNKVYLPLALIYILFRVLSISNYIK